MRTSHIFQTVARVIVGVIWIVVAIVAWDCFLVFIVGRACEWLVNVHQVHIPELVNAFFNYGLCFAGTAVVGGITGLLVIRGKLPGTKRMRRTAQK